MRILRQNKINVVMILITLLIVAITLYFNIYRFSGYKISIGSDTITFVKSKKEFNKTYNEFQSEIKAKYNNVVTKKDFSLQKIKIDDSTLFISGDNLKKVMLKKFSTEVDAFTMKSDNKKVAYVINEKQGKEILDLVQEHYSKKTKLDSITKTHVENNITYELVKTEIGNLYNNSEIASAIIEYDEKSKAPLIAVKIAGNVTKEEIKVPVQNKEILVGTNKPQTAEMAYMNTPSRGAISSTFGMRWGKAHKGIDIAANLGEVINAALDGTVVYAGWQEGYGNVVKIHHGKDVETIYAHCSKITVKQGEAVNKGEKIGEVGSTGNSTGPHLHFEVREKGEPQNPERYIK